MSPSKMFKKLQQGELAIGALMYTSGPEYVEIMGWAGLDFVKIDLMGTENDWAETANTVCAACAYGMTPIVRLPSSPFTRGGLDPHLAVDAVRAFGVGAEGVSASVNTASEVEALVESEKEAIHRPYLGRTLREMDGVTKYASAAPNPDGPGHDAMAIPAVETLLGFQAFDEMVAVPGLQAIAFSMGDLCRELGHAYDERHPEVQEKICTAIATARSHGLHTFINPLQRTSEEIAASALTFRSMGVSAVMVNPPIYTLADYYRRSRELIQSGLAT